jgi:hypothetical protein
MTKKHYEAIAKIINDLFYDQLAGSRERNILAALTEDLVQYFKADNPRFKADKFLLKALKP